MLIGISLDPDGDASTPLTLTYSIITPDSVFAPGYRAAEYTSNILASTDAFIAAVEKVFSMVTQFTGVTFVKITETATQCGDIRIGLHDYDDGYAGVSYVDYSGENNQNYQDSGDSDIWINVHGSGATSDDWSPGSYAFSTLIHEIGHSLGLDHPHGLTPNQSGYTTPVGNIITDSLWYSIMSYRDFPGDNWGDDPDGSNVVDANGNDMQPFTFMFYDIWALRYLYSVNDQTGGFIVPDVVDDEAYGLGGTGDNTYTITDTTKGMFTIFDTGGTDTIDFSTMSLDSRINLNGTLSFIGTDVINYDDGEAYSGIVIGLYWWDIENVNAGSGNDTITCNDDANLIICGPGSDTVNAIGIGDSVYGDAGDDIFVISDTSFTLIDGGDGFDTLGFDSAIWGGSVDFSTFNDSEITSIEGFQLQDNTSTSFKLTKESILNLNSTYTIDIDEDGDNDYAVYFYGDSGQDTVVLVPENWTFLKSVTEENGNQWDYYQNIDGETYFAASSGVSVYEVPETSALNISNQTVAENLANAVVGTLSSSDFNQLSPSGSINYTISGADADKFEINSDGILRIKYGTVADYESQSTYNISITGLGITKNFVISVSDAEENTIYGYTGSYTTTDTYADDHIDSAGGNDHINGLLGAPSDNDTLLLFDDSSNFTITTLLGVTQIYGNATAEIEYRYDTITMFNIETIQFADQAIAVSTTADGVPISKNTGIGLNYIYGYTGSYTITGTSWDDLINSAGGNDHFDGKGGNDTLLLFDDSSNFTITTLLGVTQIYGNATAEIEYRYDTITMFNIETIQFADQAISIDTNMNGANYIYGYTGSYTITGTSSNDLINSAGGNDIIDGKEGNDTLLLFDDSSNFTITVVGSIIEIYGNATAEIEYRYDTIKLSNVETIMFEDQTINVSDLTSSSSPLSPEENNDHSVPITPDGDDNPFPDISLWAEEYDLGLINLPLVAIDSAPLLVDVEASLEDLVMIEESMELDFSLFSENLEPLDTVPVKPITEPTSDPYVEYYYQDVMEDWMLIPMS